MAEFEMFDNLKFTKARVWIFFFLLVINSLFWYVALLPDAGGIGILANIFGFISGAFFGLYFVSLLSGTLQFTGVTVLLSLVSIVYVYLLAALIDYLRVYFGE